MQNGRVAAKKPATECRRSKKFLSGCKYKDKIMNEKKRKVTIVGAGAVGSTFAHTLAQTGLVDEICITDMLTNFALGQVMDLSHGVPFLPQVDFRVGTESDYADSDLVVITAGAKQEEGETRISLLKRNAAIVEDVAKKVAASGCKGVMVIVSNPVDVLTKIALEASGWERWRVIGSGTVLDTARFQYALSIDCDVDSRDVHGYILGEHGDSEFAAWSLTHVAGFRIEDYCKVCGKCPDGGIKNREEIVQGVRDSAYHIISYKGSTYFAISLALTRIAEAILRDEKSILSVSIALEGEYGISDVALSVPCVMGYRGVDRILASNLPPDEQSALEASAATLKEALDSIR